MSIYKRNRRAMDYLELKKRARRDRWAVVIGATLICAGLVLAASMVEL